MLNNIMSKVMGSSLTKNYEVDKEPYMHGGLHNLWKVYRAKKKDRNNMDCSLFIFEKKCLDKKKLTQAQRDEICNTLKKDPQNLTKLRHPNLLSLLEQPQEDQKFIVFATEPVEFNLSSLVFDATKKELIPGDLEVKCLCLELLEVINFLHSTAKNMHMGLAPEHIYINKEGKLKLGGLNFAQSFSTADALTVPLNFDLKINELSVVPNLRFAAPELSDQQLCSFNSDLFSIGTLIYFMMALNKGRDPFLLNQKDITDKSAHQSEVKQFERKFSSLMNGFDSDFEALIMQLCNIHNADRRGPLHETVSKAWFQDPLLKTIKYLETIDSKDHVNKMHFLTGITLILQKFDKKAMLKKVMPLLLDQMKVIQLSVNVLPSVIDVMERLNYLTTTEFREYIWPSLQKLFKAKELPAQSLYLILKNTELFMKFLGPSEFQQNFLVLINKSLECGVAKLQFLALTKIPMLIKQIDYQVVKTQLVPRILNILEKPSQIQLKQKTLEILIDVMPNIDSQTMKDKIMKTFEKLRATETDPQVCMLMLKIYEQMAKVLGVEEIGLKILPGIIPMLISGTFTRIQFTEMMSSVRRLLDQIEKHREKDLRDMGQDIPNAEKLEIEDKGNKHASIANPTNKDVFDFLGSLDPGMGQPRQTPTQMPMPTANSNPSTGNLSSNLMAGFSGLNLGSQQPAPDFMGIINNAAGANGASAFGQMGAQNRPLGNTSGGGGWDHDLPIISDNTFSQTQKQSTFQAEDKGWASFETKFEAPQPQNQSNNGGMHFGGNAQPQNQSNIGGMQMGGNSFNQFGQSQPQNQFGGNSQGLGSSGASKFGGASMAKSDDPFADLLENPNPSNAFSGNQNNFGNRPLNQMGFGGVQQSAAPQTNQMGGGGLNFNYQQNNNTNFNAMGQSFGGSFQQQQTNQNNFGSTSINIPSSNNPFDSILPSTGSMGFNNNMSQFGGAQSTFGGSLNQHSQSAQPFNNNNLAGLNFNQGSGSYGTQMAGQQNNSAQMSFGMGMNLGGGLQQNQQQTSGGGGFDTDFFSQFTQSNNQQKQSTNPNFGF